MSNPFAEYGKRATSQAPAKLIGPIATRAAARLRYSEIVAELTACEDPDQLDAYLGSLSREIAQFRAELHFFWDGDGMDFPGLANEIEQAKARCDEARLLPGNW